MLILFDFKNDLSYSYSVWDSVKRALNKFTIAQVMGWQLVKHCWNRNTMDLSELLQQKILHTLSLQLKYCTKIESVYFLKSCRIAFGGNRSYNLVTQQGS